jgi:hypothetical protein
MKLVTFALMLAMSLSVFAGEPHAAVKKEISHLISHLATSGCQFNRNGKWYDSSRAVSHLNRKYDYLLKRDLVPTAEAFIERAASESSASGKPYLVKCGEEPEVQSAAWFRAALEKFRSESNNVQEHH